jgi:hypothetical protein
MFKKRSRVILLAISAAIIIIAALMIYTYFFSHQGLQVGDQFTYDIKGFWGDSSDPDVTPSPSFLELNMTEWFKVTVTDVSEEEVSINTSWLFNNGTEVNATSTINLKTGITYPSEGFWAIYAPNLNKGDYIRPTGPDRSTVNETQTRDYGAGVTRETNLVSLKQEAYDANDPTYTRTLTEYTNTHFDRQTGMLVELHYVSVYTNPDMTLTVTWKITDSNVWNIS